jgi:hypothetical protein
MAARLVPCGLGVGVKRGRRDGGGVAGQGCDEGIGATHTQHSVLVVQEDPMVTCDSMTMHSHNHALIAQIVPNLFLVYSPVLSAVVPA